MGEIIFLYLYMTQRRLPPVVSTRIKETYYPYLKFAKKFGSFKYNPYICSVFFLELDLG